METTTSDSEKRDWREFVVLSTVAWWRLVETVLTNGGVVGPWNPG